MQNVKSTMINHLLSYVAPHLCCGCGKIGTLLCDNCKYNITSEYFVGCIACGTAAGGRGICSGCRVPYSHAWCVGERSGELRRLIDGYKFENMYAAHSMLAQLLAKRLDQLPSKTIIVPMPTVASHIRQRGYDHTLLIARGIANAHHLKLNRKLYRLTTTTQRGAGRAVRIAQAKQAFAVKGKLEPGTPYLLIDDVLTTGATIKYATRALREAGATEVWAAVVARQPLD